MCETQHLEADAISVEKGKALTIIRWKYMNPADYAWLFMDQEYDMKKTEEGYEVTVPTEAYDQNKKEIQIVISEGDKITTFVP